MFLGDWSAATLLSLYWWENACGSVLVALRIAIHRALTRKRGYRRLQLDLNTNSSAADGKGTREGRGRRRRPPLEKPGSFLAEFLVAACAATAVHGLLLWFFVAKILERTADGTALRQGVLGVAGFQLAGFLLDLPGIRARPFAWIRELAQNTVSRVMLIHLVLIVGVWFGLRAGTAGILRPFTVLKAMADVGNLLARAGVRADPEEAPAWLVATMNRLGGRDRGDFGEHWRQQKAEQRRLAEQDEQVER